MCLMTTATVSLQRRVYRVPRGSQRASRSVCVAGDTSFGRPAVWGRRSQAKLCQKKLERLVGAVAGITPRFGMCA